MAGSEIDKRKQEHIDINLNYDVSSSVNSEFNAYYFNHEALPEFDLDTVDTTVDLFGKKLKTPLLISSMTGGIDSAIEINRRLAEAAQHCSIAMGVGSQRPALTDPTLSESYQLRRYAPDALLFANIGAVQLNYELQISDCQRAVDMLEADALILHLNPLQEALQPEGNTRFAGLAKKIAEVCRKIEVPVIVKEVGWGISGRTAVLLQDAGVQAIDVAGAGGTSWSQVEMYRQEESMMRETAAAFQSWGLTTMESIKQVKQHAPECMIFASGGITSGIDSAKCIAMGASVCGMAGKFLHAAVHSSEETIRTIRTFEMQLRIAMFAAGIRSISELRGTSQLQCRERCK